jgi:hypothetical protein
LWDLNYNTIEIQQVHYLPPIFDGDIIFELHVSSQDGHSGQMKGNNCKYDDHVWGYNDDHQHQNLFQPQVQSCKMCGAPPLPK